jgi:ABC-2 type transport system ATP-binding protein
MARIDELQRLPIGGPASRIPPEPESVVDVIVASGLRKHYGPVEAVAGITLAVAAGQIVAVLGPNGAGKTTTIELLLGLRRPSAGQVRVFGQRPDAPRVRGRVGAMLQDANVPESLTVAELVGLVGRYYPYALPVGEVLSKAGLVGRDGVRVGELSGGQRQRLSFALAIVGDPDLLFLDEPTVALDVEARRGFWEQVRGFTALGKTILFSTHYLAEADAFADRVVVIHQGRVLKDAPPAAIKALVAAKTVRLATDLPLAEVRRIDGVEHAEIQPSSPGDVPAGLERLVVQSNAPEQLLRELVSRGVALYDLTVVDTDLEAAFVRLTRGDRVQEAAA